MRGKGDLIAPQKYFVEIGLILEYIQCSSSDLSRCKAIHQRFLIHYPTAGAIDDHHAFFHGSDPRMIDKRGLPGGMRHVEGDKITSLADFFYGYALDSEFWR